MTALGFLYPGHAAEDDYPRMEQLLGSDIRMTLVHTEITEITETSEITETGEAGDPGKAARRVDALREMGSADRLAAGVEELRLSGAEAVVWACTSGSFVYGWQGAHEQIRGLARAAGLPASSTSLGFAHAVREIGARRVAVAATYGDEVAGLFAAFLGDAGVEVASVRGAGGGGRGRRRSRAGATTRSSPWPGRPTIRTRRRFSSPTPPSTRSPTSPPSKRPSPNRSSPPTR